MKTLLFITIILLALAIPRSQTYARSTATYELVKNYIGPGGGGSAGSYSISSSIGQPVVGEVSAGNYTLGGGFWGGGIIVPVQNNYRVYLPVVLR